MGHRNGVPATHSASQTRVNALLLSRGAPRGDERIHPTALSNLPPAVTATSTKAMTQGAVPLFTQLWMVPRCSGGLGARPSLGCVLDAFVDRHDRATVLVV